LAERSRLELLISVIETIIILAVLISTIDLLLSFFVFQHSSTKDSITIINLVLQNKLIIRLVILGLILGLRLSSLFLSSWTLLLGNL
jgi:hypothetical protein